MEASTEDFYEGPNIIKCTCGGRNTSRLKRDCPNCCEKCHECQMHRKSILSFDYLSFIPHIVDICKSRTTYFEFLEVWRQHQS